MQPTSTVTTQSTLRAAPQRGYLWRTDELLRLGYNSRSIKYLLDSGELRRMRYGCYMSAGKWDSMGPRSQALARIMAHAHGTLTTSTGGLVYSHLSAARLHGLFLWGVDQKVHVLHPVRPSSGRWGKDVRGHTEALAETEIVTVRGLRVTSLERTMFDCAKMLSYPKALVIMDHGLRLGADRNVLASMGAASAGKRGIRIFRKALENADPRSESAGETLSRELMQRLRIKPPEPQFRVKTRVGNHRLDFAWEEEKLALEFDGKTKYFDYKPTDEVIFEERRREKALMEDGWRFIRIEWKDLFQERTFKERILRALRSRR
ncbi:type IV toxin-antitoxin system AbiEi family antitoxin domain-containing protein [Paenarthrobacter ureafaciens]|uniref:type IV toxin-antitoxin system AbiEi family antitoxin domain-containing protein n=1 Tax=Paenarthrobacter ureafaciens TaxID=37931 RepID=UPI003CF39CAE